MTKPSPTHRITIEDMRNGNKIVATFSALGPDRYGNGELFYDAKIDRFVVIGNPLGLDIAKGRK